MHYVVTQPCCSDASCVYACPVNCIHPTPDEPDFLTAEMLHIDPQTCVSCGACVSACPVDAIVASDDLTEQQRPFLQINADFYKDRAPDRPVMARVTPTPAARQDSGPLRVAIVGSGPAAMFAADELLLQPGARVNVFEKLPTPHGLVRAGVAPDHQKTKQVTELFETIADEPGFEYFLNVEVGRHVTHEELLADHHAVIYAVGCSADKRLNVPGDHLCESATDFVAWYNGHPSHANDAYDLSAERVVIIGNGNVALDVARILTLDPELLAHTDIADQALAALRSSAAREVVILGRRGPAHSAFTVPELTGLLQTGIPVYVDAPADLLADPPDVPQHTRHLVHTKLAMLRALPRAENGRVDRQHGDAPHIVLRYLASPTAILGTDRATGVEFERTEVVDGRAKGTGILETIDAGLVLSSIGYHGEAVAGVPFDEITGTIPNVAGRVIDAATGRPAPGTYAVGWIKRGPTGFIGTNKSCSQETVRALIEDFNAGRLTAPTQRHRDFVAALLQVHPEVVDRAGWHRIDRAERTRGTAQGRARVKLSDTDELLRVATDQRRRNVLRQALGILGR